MDTIERVESINKLSKHLDKSISIHGYTHAIQYLVGSPCIFCGHAPVFTMDKDDLYYCIHCKKGGNIPFHAHDKDYLGRVYIRKGECEQCQ